MFSNLMRGWAQKRYRKEAMTLLEHLRTLDNESVGLVLAIATHHRNALLQEGVDLRDLSTLAATSPMYQHELAKAVNVLTRNKRQHDSLGLQIWVHSLRCVADQALFALGNELWRELKRGQPHVAKARELVASETGFELDITMANEVPPEFTEPK
jgi:hypothetical protein